MNNFFDDDDPLKTIRKKNQQKLMNRIRQNQFEQDGIIYDLPEESEESLLNEFQGNGILRVSDLEGLRPDGRGGFQKIKIEPTEIGVCGCLITPRTKFSAKQCQYCEGLVCQKCETYFCVICSKRLCRRCVMPHLEEWDEQRPYCLDHYPKKGFWKWLLSK